eukprot:11832-Heterococcus_DN1.PRE.2
MPTIVGICFTVSVYCHSIELALSCYEEQHNEACYARTRQSRAALSYTQEQTDGTVSSTHTDSTNPRKCLPLAHVIAATTWEYSGSCAYTHFTILTAAAAAAAAAGAIIIITVK